jgi:hypothetical protein
MKEDAVKTETEEDEISIDAFLQELGEDDSEDTAQPEEAADLSAGPEETVEDTAGVGEKEPEELPENDTGHTGDVLSEHEKKSEALIQRKNDVDFEMAKLEQELENINRQLKALDIVRRMFS